MTVMATSRFSRWLQVRPEGLFVPAGGFFIDPVRPVDKAVITHGHADHARPGSGDVLATPATLAIMQVRYGDQAWHQRQGLDYGERLRIGDATITLYPAGHVLGSAQVLIEVSGVRIVVTGDYKREPDPTCAAFEAVRADLLVTEATFGLPVFRHPPPSGEIDRLIHSMGMFGDRAHVVGVYALGKCQRLIALLRAAGFAAPIYLHGALDGLCDLYEAWGVDLGPRRSVVGVGKPDLAGQLVLAPPSAIADRWARRLPDPLVAAASGWMRVRQRARQRGVELPLVISDHADWPELLQTVEDVDPEEVWVTHGREEALVHAVRLTGRRAEALALVGFDEDAQG